MLPWLEKIERDGCRTKEVVLVGKSMVVDADLKVEGGDGSNIHFKELIPSRVSCLLLYPGLVDLLVVRRN